MDLSSLIPAFQEEMLKRNCLVGVEVDVSIAISCKNPELSGDEEDFEDLE